MTGALASPNIHSRRDYRRLADADAADRVREAPGTEALLDLGARPSLLILARIRRPTAKEPGPPVVVRRQRSHTHITHLLVFYCTRVSRECSRALYMTRYRYWGVEAVVSLGFSAGYREVYSKCPDPSSMAWSTEAPRPSLCRTSVNSDPADARLSRHLLREL